MAAHVRPYCFYLSKVVFYDIFGTGEVKNMSCLHIRVGTHYFVIGKIDATVKGFIYGFAFKYKEWEYRQTYRGCERNLKHNYYSSNEGGSWYRFHISALGAFKEYWRSRYVNESAITYSQEESIEIESVDLKIKPIYSAREYQEKGIDFLTSPIDPKFAPTRLLPFRTGRGKSYTCMAAAVKLGVRIVVMVRAIFLDKWKLDLQKTYELSDGDLVVIRGTDNMNKVFASIHSGALNPKIILISMDTHIGWIRAYERHGDGILSLGYVCLPDKMYGYLKAGLCIMDEVHMHFHRCYIESLYTNIPGGRTIGLSATLFSKYSFLSARQKELFPPACRHNDDAGINYAHVETIHYSFKKPQYIRTKEHGSTMFSLNAFEESIYKYVPTRINFFEMIKHYLEASFLTVKREKKRCLILMQRRETIITFVKYLQHHFPDLDIREYISKEKGKKDINDLYTPDIVVSTYGSAGTAMDVPDLTNLMVVLPMNGDQAVIQILGRLRLLEDHSVLLQWFTASNIDECISKHNDRLVVYKRFAKTHRSTIHDVEI